MLKTRKGGADISREPHVYLRYAGQFGKGAPVNQRNQVMSGTSARETSRPAQRPRPSATDHSSNVAPPVLFRLPSISQGVHEEDRFGASAAMPRSALAMGSAGSPTSSLAASTQAAQQAAVPRTVTPPTTAAALAATKVANQRLLTTVVIAIVLVALAIISMIAFRGGEPSVQPEVAGKTSDSREHLESLSDIRVPDVSMPQSQTANALAVAEAETKASQESADATSGVQLSLDKSRASAGSGSAERSHLTLEASDLARKPNGTSAQVQLGTPVPMQSTVAAASQEGASQTNNSSLPLTTPRYETVSTPSAASNASGNGSSANTGASPSLWDGAKKPAHQPSNSQPGALLSGSTDSEMSLVPSDYSGSLAKPTNAQPVSSQTSVVTRADAQAASVDSLGVTVGAGMTQPEFPQAKATATPDLDVAAISSKYLEYSRQKNFVTASTTSTEIANPYAPATTAAVPVSNSGPAVGAYPQSSAGAGVPYGTTGTTLTPYVRNSPTGSVSSGPGSAAPSTGMMIPPQNGAAISAQPQYPTGSPATGYSMPGPATSTAYPSQSAVNTGYAQSSASNGTAGYNAGYSSAANSPGGFTIPPRGTGTASPQMNAGAAGTVAAPSPAGPYGYPAATQNRPQNYPATQNYGYAQGAMAPMANPGYQSAPTSGSPYPGGQAPQGMIGQSGFATAPSGDVTPPTPVTGKVGYGTSPTR